MNLSTVFVISGILSFGAVGQEPTQAPATPTQTPQAAPAKKAPPATKPAYKVDDKDVYKVSIQMTGSQAATIEGTLTEKVKKIYDNGDADLEETVSDVKSTGEVPPTSTEAHTLKVNQFGVLQGDIMQSPLSFATLAAVVPEVKDLLDLDQSWPIDRSLMGGAKLAGNVKVVGQEWPDSQLGLQGTMEVPGGGDMHGKVKADYLWSAKDNRYNKVVVTFVISPPAAAGVGDITMTMSFERVIPAPAKKG